MKSVNLVETPIEMWKKIVESPNLTEKEVRLGLEKIYKKYFPRHAEIIVNPHCPNQCKHCIYPIDYPCYNKSLDLEVWKKIIKILYEKLKFRQFNFGGRGFNETLLNLLKWMNQTFPNSKIGLIIDGPSIKKYYNKINKIKLYNMDISIDGLEKTHDNQRNLQGSFNTTIKQIKKLLSDNGPVEKGLIRKIGILTCLTQINKNEVIPMIKYLNKTFGLRDSGTKLINHYFLYVS